MEKQVSDNSAVRWVTVEEEFAGQRLDNFLMRELRGVPKSRIYNALRRGEVRVNKARAKPAYKLVPGDQVRIPPVRVKQATTTSVPGGLAERIKSAILYEDDGLLIVNKPSGLAVHGGSGVSLGLIESLRQIFPDQKHLELVHRLDRDTSGCVMVSKKRAVLKQLHEMLRYKPGAEKGVDKRYLALVAGSWPARKSQVKVALAKNVLRSGERVVRASPEGKSSLTETRLLGRIEEASLIEARPITGRTHQIRVHLAARKHPLVGDSVYGGRATRPAGASERLLSTLTDFSRQALHARELTFLHPDSSQAMHFSAPIPADLADLIHCLSEEDPG